MADAHIHEIDAGGGDEPLPKWKVRDLCRRARNGVLSRNLCTKDEVDALDPGEDAPYNAQWHYYAAVWRIREREKFVSYGSEYASRKLMAALDREPIELELLSGRTVTIHPKSEAALHWFSDAYYWLNWFNVRYWAIQQQAEHYEAMRAKGEEPMPGLDAPITATEDIVAETNRRVALIMWAGCHEGPGLPWAYSERAPDQPYRVVDGERINDPFWLDLASQDVQSIERAMHEVNSGRLHFLPKPKERGKGVTAEQFFAQRAKQTGRPISELRRGQDLASQVAGVVLAEYREDA